MGVTWTRSPQVLVDGMQQYADRAKVVVAMLLERFQVPVEEYAKANPPWQDRTANARQTLFTVVDVAQDTVSLYLSHGMEYGKWLELCNSGRYAIIMPTLEAHYGAIKASLDDLFRG